MSIRKLVKSITGHPLMTTLMAPILIATNTLETWGTIGEDLTEVNLGAYHGKLLLGSSVWLADYPIYVKVWNV